MFENREYRKITDRKNLTGFKITSGQTDLQIYANRDLSAEAIELVLKYRAEIESYINMHPEFGTTLEPFILPSQIVPPIIQYMVESSSKASVGPMASVAGAISEFVGKGLMPLSSEVIVENGGDVFLSVKENVTIGIYAGDSPFSMKIGLRFENPEKPFGVCTSSGKVGHSLSFGKSDAVCVVSDSTSLADSAATSIGNWVKKSSDIEKAINYGQTINGVEGIVIIVEDKIGMWGDIDIVKL